MVLALSLKRFRWGGRTKQARPEVDIELGMVIVLWVLSFKGRRTFISSHHHASMQQGTVMGRAECKGKIEDTGSRNSTEQGSWHREDSCKI